MDKLLINNEYYLFSNNEYDKIFNDILNATSYNLKDNLEDMVGYFADNIVFILNDMFVPVDEDNDCSEIINGFRNYLNYLISL